MGNPWFAAAAPKARTFIVMRCRVPMRHVYDYEYYRTPGCTTEKRFRTLVAAEECALKLNAQEATNA